MTTNIIAFLYKYFHSENFKIEPILNSASDRKYFRVKYNNKNYILTYSENIQETKSFIYFSKIFEKYKVPVPEILTINESSTIYLQEDLGSMDLLSILLEKGEGEEIEKLYKRSLTELINLQFDTVSQIDYSQCYDFQKFDKNLIFNDLNYFKFYFFQPLEIPYSGSKLLNEFTCLSEKIENMSPLGFVYRDFQARNIMIKGEHPYFIDYQGGMLGNTIYDLVSLLWQAKAKLSNEFKVKLKNYYFTEVNTKTGVSTNEMETAYQHCLIIRLLQVLGAYGFRGILQKKQHFIDSISDGIQNLKVLSELPIISDYPELSRIINILQEKETLIKIQNLIKNE